MRGELTPRRRVAGAGKLIGVLSLEYLNATPLSEEMLQLVRHSAQLLGHWQPLPEPVHNPVLALPSSPC